MIYESLYILQKSLDQYLKTSTNSDETESLAILGNIAFSEQSSLDEHQDINNKVVLTLVSVDEDPTLKNQKNVVRRGESYEKINTPVFANLNVLISAYYPNNYSNSLKQLTRIVEFFQGQSKMRFQDNPLQEIASSRNIKDLEIRLELMTMNFEQLNHLWGSMGGKVIPSVLYKARIVEIERGAVQGKVAPVTHIKINEN